jgi:hypothetical protein
MTTAAAQVDAGYPSEWDDVQSDGGPARPPARPWSERRSSQYELACNLRDGLRAALGGVCKKCGTAEALEFHHPDGRDWAARKKNLAQRMRLYWRDFRAGRLELLCSGCNKAAGAPQGFWQRAQAKKEKRR